MAKTDLLSTRTINFLELIGNGRAYRVPAYQRDYSWGEEQWDDLWEDICAQRNQPKGRHYMGAIVLEARSDREFLVIDGQQRLATLSIVALAAISVLESLGEEEGERNQNHQRAETLRARFVGEKDAASLIETSKLTLNETDDPFYQDYLVQLREPPNPRGLPKSSRSLWECFTYYRKRIAESSASGEDVAHLISETVARQLVFISIEVQDEVNAYTVFETLNARGVGLTTTDLLKNYLFSRVHVKADLVVLQRRWKALVSTTRQESFPEFLRYHLLCESPKIRTQQLYKIVRSKASTPQDVFNLITALEARAELFAALSDPNHAYWLETPSSRQYIYDLGLFRVRQMTPLLFAAWEKLRNDFESILRLVSVISFRYSVVSGRNTNALEPAYHRAAAAVLNGKATTARAVFSELRDIYVADSQFVPDFTLLTLDTSGQRRKLAKYVLARLESEVSGKPCDATTDPATVEHILPENPTDDWADEFLREYWDAATYRVGNLTLLEAPANRRVGNSPYPDKVAAYEASKYALTRELARIAPSIWNVETLNKRQQSLAKMAAHIWRVDL